MARVVRKVIDLHPAQAEFRHSPAIYRAFCGGRGAGKTFAGAYDLIRRAERGRVYMIVGPTYPNLRDSSMRAFIKLAREMGVLDPSAMKLSAPPQLTLSTGAEILFRSGDDPERLRGPSLAGAWLDEASLMSRSVYDVMIATLRDEGRQGWLSATFTPKGSSHWTFETFATAKPNTSFVRAPTADNPFLPDAFAATLQEQFGDTLYARQELNAEFVSLEGAEFPGEWFARPDLWFDAWPDAGTIVLSVLALDPSKGSDGKGTDYQAHVLICVTVEGGRYVYYVDADLHREGVVAMTERTVSLCKGFFAVTGRQIDSVVIEDNATMGLLPPAIDAAVLKLRYPIPAICRPSSGDKEFRIRYYLGPPLSRYQIRFRRTPGARLLVGQAQSFPRDEHDDGPDALSIALRRVAEMLGGGR